MSNLQLLVISLIAFVLVSGCSSMGTRQADRRPTAPMGPFLTIASETITPTPMPTSKYCYEKNGKLYQQPPNFVCTETNPEYLYGPKGLVCVWCDRGDLVYPPTEMKITPTNPPVSTAELNAVLARPETYCIGSDGYLEWREGRPVSGVYCAAP